MAFALRPETFSIVRTIRAVWHRAPSVSRRPAARARRRARCGLPRALAAQAEQRARLRARRHAHLDRAVERRHLDHRAERRLRDRDRHLAGDDAALAPEDRMRLARARSRSDRRAVRRAARARPAPPRAASRRPRCRRGIVTVNSRSFSTVPAPLHASHGSSTTLPLAAAGRALLRQREEALLHLDLAAAAAAAARAQARLRRPWRRCRLQVAQSTRDGKLDRLLDAERRLFERQLERVAQIAPGASCAPFLLAEQIAEQRLEQIGEAAEVDADAAADAVEAARDRSAARLSGSDSTVYASETSLKRASASGLSGFWSG